MRLGSGDATAKPDVAELLGDKVRFADDSIEQIDVIIYATGYNITFPFFDPDFISAPDNKLHLYKRMFMPGMDDLVFIGLAQAIPTLFPFVELQGRLLAEYLSGEWALPSKAEMEQSIRDDEAKFIKHYANRPTAHHAGRLLHLRARPHEARAARRAAARPPKGCVTPRCVRPQSIRRSSARPSPTSWDREPLHPGLRHRTQTPSRPSTNTVMASSATGCC